MDRAADANVGANIDAMAQMLIDMLFCALRDLNEVVRRAEHMRRIGNNGRIRLYRLPVAIPVVPQARSDRGGRTWAEIIASGRQGQLWCILVHHAPQA